jgi:cobalt-zinc-cadmium efflux system protein
VQAVERVLNPIPVQGLIPIVIGIAAALANWGVARLLWKPSRDNAAIRLAYIHNIGDVWVSLAPVVAGVLLTLTGYSIFDPLIAGAIAQSGSCQGYAPLAGFCAQYAQFS